MIDIDDSEQKVAKRNYHIKAYESSIRNWKRAAAKSGVPVSEWCRDNLDSIVHGSVTPKFSDTEMLRGRKSTDDELAVSFQFRVTGWQVSEWKQCADSVGLAIGEWCRQSLDYCAMVQSMRKAI